ncbi:2-hydroxyacyl-CoA dehydratase subunit D [Gilvimarinus sp. F26214L]|uniref:2-hydroxyacyl-CoA dehydratase subunit D n=1 Tax=Gilvimarinus sp. DZF01 TaxID=3461371 RepID=UPI0040466C78
MTISAIQDLTAISQDPAQSARGWKAHGRPVVGYLSNNVPLEIIHAAGMLPFHLQGDPQQEPALANEYMEPAFDPVTRSVFNRLLAGEYDFLDLIVLPRSNDAHQRLYYYLCEMKRAHSRFPLPPVFLVDILHSPRESTAAHNRKKITEFARFLEDQSGTTLDDAALARAIEQYNCARHRLNSITQLRAEASVHLSSTLVHQLYTAARSIAITDFNSLVETLPTELPHGEGAKNQTPIVLAGNGPDHPGLHTLIDDLGGRVAGDYHSLGNHFLAGRVDENLDPMEALSRYYGKTRSSRTFMDAEDLITFARQQSAAGILFFYMHREEALTWHYPRQRDAAQSAGLKTLLLSEQDYDLNTEAIRPLLEEFLNQS